MSSPSSSAFARVFGSPGEAPRLMGLLRVFTPLFAACLLAGYLLRAAWPVPALQPVQVGFCLLLLVGLLAGVLVRSRQRLQNYLKGARGEEEVARLLSFLPASYSVFHGVSLGASGGDIDHVVLGPTGMFALETKNWSGRVTLREGRLLLDGEALNRSPLDQARSAAERLERALRTGCGLTASVQPVVCFVASRLEGGRTGVGGVVLCGRSDLLDVIRDSTEAPPDPEGLRLAAQLLEAQVAAQGEQQAHL